MKKIVCSLLVIFILISEFSFCFGTTENAVISNEVKSSENAVDVNDDTENVKPKNKIQNETNAKEENTKENENKKETNVTNEAVKTEEKKVEVNNKVESAPVVQEAPKSTQTNQSIKTNAISTAGMQDGLYVDTVSMFERDEETGMLTRKFTLPISGEYPKDLVLLPDDKHLVLANHASNTLTTFTVDYEKNIIVMNGKPIKIAQPNSIRIWPVPEE